MKLYNGAPCSQLQALWDSEDAAEKEIRKLGCRITYFPLEGGYYLCDAETYRTVGDKLFNRKYEAAAWLKAYKNQGG